MVEVTVYRYGHRPARDKRITTHLALTARAFGARRMVMDTRDESIENVVADITRRFGGSFAVSSGTPWRPFLSSWKGCIVHLTMYGQPLPEVMGNIRGQDEVLVLVGSQKVPADFYQRAHYNVAVGNQPHSEVAALALFLDRITEGRWMDTDFFGPLTVVPQERGKKVVERDYRQVLRDVGCSEQVIQHAEKVQHLALAIARRLQQRGFAVDLQAVSLGALFHDVGRSSTHHIHHITEGAAIARRLGLPDSVVGIIQRHAGAGIDPREAESLGLPPGDYMPRTLEEEIVAHADNLTGLDYRPLAEAVQKIRHQAGDKAADRVQALHARLSEMCGCDLDHVAEELA